jgi:hypothetical protein
VAAYLREHCDGLPLRIAIARVHLYVEQEALRSQAALLEELAEKRTVVIHPVPPHVAELLLVLPELTVLLLEEDHVPPHLRHAGVTLCTGFRQCQRQLATAEAVVLEAQESPDGALVVDEIVADLLTGPTRAGVIFVAHVHPHPLHHTSGSALDAPAQQIRFI